MTATPSDTLFRPFSAAPRGRTRLVLLAAMIVMAGLLTVGWATPASAAATPATATVCFKHTNGAAWTYDQIVQRWEPGVGWVNAATGRSVNGCTTWTLPSGYYWRFQASYRVSRTYWFASTDHLYAYAGGQMSFGTYWVYPYSY
jgi:hypothetical protein